MNSLEHAIREHPFLKDLSDINFQALVDSAMQMEFAPGQIIFREGDLANRFYLIQSGKVVLETDEKDRQPTVIDTIGANDALGWSWLFPPFYWHFTARASEPTRAIFFYGTRLREQCEENHELGYELMRRMAAVVTKRLQATRRELLKFTNAHHK